MIGVVLLSLFVMIVVAGCIGVVMFWDVAFSGAGSPRGALKLPQQAPRMQEGCNGVNLALRVEQSVSRLMQRLGTTRVASDACEPAREDREIHVTTPEVLAIVNELRERLSSREVDAICAQARRNLAVSEGSRRCPLRLSNGDCACAGARPISCRAHSLVGTESHSGERQLAESIGAGAIEIFRDCLHATGLDDSEYELNQALVQSLDTPHAARRWTQGERILASASSCRA